MPPCPVWTVGYFVKFHIPFYTANYRLIGFHCLQINVGKDTGWKPMLLMLKTLATKIPQVAQTAKDPATGGSHDGHRLFAPKLRNACAG